MGKHYDELIRLSREVSDYSSIGAVLSWDQETYLPPRGARARGRHLGQLSALAHRLATAPEVGAAIRGAEGEKLEGAAAVNLREIRRSYERQTRIPTELVRELTETSVAARQAWKEARAKDEFPIFAPFLEKLVALRRRYAEAIGFDGEPYDALLDGYEQGMTAAEVSRIFDGLRPRLVALAAKIRGARPLRTDFLHRSFPAPGQARLGRRVLELMGFDFQAGRFDVSAHPFCTSFSPDDVRLTVRYDESFFNAAFFGLMHEGGHGLYEQGLPSAHEGTPAGEAVSLGIHESQSRLWENQVGRSRAFWRHFFPFVREEFPDALRDVTEEEMWRAVNEAKPSLIRVEADEVYYNLHIMLRFEIERGLLLGTVRPADTPALWKERMEQYVGVRSDTDADGVLQDIHWSGGMIGYFPTYSLGNLYAAQFLAAARKAIPDLDERIGRGDLRGLLAWLRTNIHAHGMTWRAPELVEKVTGEAPNPDYLVSYLERKYAEVYGI